MLQWSRSPRSQPRNARFNSSVSSRSVLARHACPGAGRGSRDTATLFGWITQAFDAARPQPTGQPEAVATGLESLPRRRPGATAIRVIVQPALRASSRQRCRTPTNAVSSGGSFFAGWRAIPGTMAATSQLDWLISITAISVLFSSRAAIDLLRSFEFGCGMGHPVGLFTATMVPFPRRSPHSISCNPVRGESPQPALGRLRCAGRSLVRRSAPAPFAVPSVPPGLARLVSPADAFPGSPVWGCSTVGCAAGGRFRCAVLRSGAPEPAPAQARGWRPDRSRTS